MNSIEVEHLTKKFGDFIAVDDISFQVREGEIFGFLGANGAGKTTAIKMMSGLLKVTRKPVRQLWASVPLFFEGSRSCGFVRKVYHPKANNNTLPASCRTYIVRGFSINSMTKLMPTPVISA